jgi:hypothetical protein
MRARSGTCRLLAAVASGLVLLTCGPAAAQDTLENKALGQPATASSVELPERKGACAGDRNGCGPNNATDGAPQTRWGSDWLEGQWWQVDLGRARAVDNLDLTWEYSFPSRYLISTSLDGATFTDAATVDVPSVPVFRNGDAFDKSTGFPARLARFVRVTSILRYRPQWGISLWEARVTGPADASLGPSPPPPVAPPPDSDPPFEMAAAQSAGRPAAPAPSLSTAPRAARRPLLRPFPVVRIRGYITETGSVIQLLEIRRAHGARVRVVCRGATCPRRVMRRRGSGPVRAMRGFLRAGTVIEVFVTRKGRLGKYARVVIRKGTAPPQRTDGCAADGAKRASPCAE